MVRLHTLDLRLVIGRRLRNVSDLTSKPVESGCHDSLRMPKACRNAHCLQLANMTVADRPALQRYQIT